MEQSRLTNKQKKILWTGTVTAGILLVLLLVFGILIPSVLRSFFTIAYEEKIEAESVRNHLDPFLVCAVIFCESRYDPDAVSRAGARGLMQIMPSTGEEIASALGEQYDPDMLFDPETSIRYGTFYLEEQMNRFNKNTAVVLAAYNAGPHRAEQWIADYGFDSRNHIAYIPYGETRKYVDKVLKVQKVYELLYWNKFSAKANGE